MADPYQGLNGSFAGTLHQLMSAVQQQGGNLTIASGFRDTDQQQQLYNNAVQKYGAANAGKWAAKPGSSNHEKGLAADIHGDAHSMQLAHQLAPTLGLNFPLANESWHIEPNNVQALGGIADGDNQGGPTPTTDSTGDDAHSRVGALINALSGGSAGLMGTGSYSDPMDATHQTDPTTGASTSNFGPTSYDSVFQQAAQQYGISPTLLKAVAKQESGFNPNAKSGAGAEGIMQFMPGTAASNGVNPMDPNSAINGAAKLLASYQRQFGSPELALAAYNAGPGNVQKYGGIPPFAETQNYVKNIMGMVNA